MLIPMNPEWKAKWLAALRGGEYKQAVGLLHDPNEGGFCCLGVLCDITKEAVGGRWDGPNFVTALHSTNSIPPASVAQTVGLGNNTNPSVVSFKDVPESVQNKLKDNDISWADDERVAVAALNDKGASFAEIADYIEKAL